MECEVRYYGMLGEKLGFEFEVLNIDEELKDLSDLKKSFIDRFPILKLMTFQVAVDGAITNEIAGKNIKTIALLPPFAGG